MLTCQKCTSFPEVQRSLIYFKQHNAAIQQPDFYLPLNNKKRKVCARRIQEVQEYRLQLELYFPRQTILLRLI